MKLQSRPGLVLMLCAHVLSFFPLSLGTSSLSWGLGTQGPITPFQNPESCNLALGFLPDR